MAHQGRPSKRAPVPLLLSSFPVPPSHIPPPPSNNPPPTGPPSLPLPPLPSRPSPISEHDQLLILSSVRSRRSSNYSNASPNRDSIVSSRSPSSISRSNSLTTTLSTPSPFQQLSRISIPLSDISDSDTEAPKSTSPVLSSNSPRHLRPSHRPNDSISSIDMREVLRVSPDDVDAVHQLPPRARYNTITDPIDPENLLSNLDPFIPPSAPSFSPALSPSRRSPAAGLYSHSLHRSLSGSHRPAHARSSSTATTVPGPGSHSQTQTPTQGHMRSLSNSSAPRTISLGRGGFGLGLELPPSPSTLISTSQSFSPTSSASSASPLRSTPPTSAGTDSKLPDSYSTTTQFSTISSSSSSPTAIKNSPLENERTTVDLPIVHHRSLSHPSLGGIVITKTTTITSSATAIPTKDQTHGRGKGSDEMTLDELSSNRQDDYTSTQPPRVPSPDIATILSVMPRPALSLSRSTDGKPQSRSKSRASAGQRRVVSVTNTGIYPEHRHPHAINLNRRQSEGTANAHGRILSSELAYLHNGKKSSLSRSTSAASVSGYYDQEVEDYDEALERVLEGGGSEEEGVGLDVGWDNSVKDSRRGRRSRGNVVRQEGEEGGGDSDSSLDLHTPLPHLMLRHGLLSPNSKLLPQADCSRAATPLDGRPGSILSVISNGSVMTKSGIIKDERDTVTRRVRHRDGKLLRGGIGLTTGLGWSDSEDEDAPSPLTRRLSSLNLSRRSSASSIYSPPLSAPLSSSSLRRIHPLSRSYSSGAILETEREHDDFEPFNDYSYDYDDEEEEEEQEDHTLEESGQWAQRHRLAKTSQLVSWQRRHQPPPSARSQNRRKHQSQTASRTSTGSIGSGFSLEVTIPESNGSVGEERSKTPSRLRRPNSHASNKSSIGATGGRDSTGSSSLDHRSSGFSSSGQRRSGGEDSNLGTGNGNTPSSTSSTLSIPMPSTPKDIFDPAAPPLMSSTRGMLAVNKEKSLPPLPAGGLKKKSSGNLQRSNGTSSTTASTPTTTAATASGALSGTGKYAFPSARIRTFSTASAASTSTPSPTSPVTTAIGGGSSSILLPSSSAASIKLNVRPLQLPRQTTRLAGDRPAVPVPSPTLNSRPLTPASTAMSSLRAPTPSLSTLPRHRPSHLSLGNSAGTASAPNSPAMTPMTPTMTGSSGIGKPKPRTGTGMVYRTSSNGAGSKMRAPMILSGTSSAVSNVSVSGGGAGAGGGGSIGRTNSFVGAIAL